MSPPPPWTCPLHNISPDFQRLTPLFKYTPPPCRYWNQSFKEAENCIQRYCSRSSRSAGGFVFRELEGGGGVFETNNLVAAPNDADELKMGIPRCSGAKYNHWPLFSANPSISVSSPKPISSNMDSRSVLPTKIPSFSYSNVYPPISLNPPAPFRGEIKSNSVTSSFSGEGS